MAKSAQNSLIALGTEKWRKQRIPSLRRNLDPHGSSARSPAGTGVAKIAHRDGMRPSASIPQPPPATCRSALASRLGRRVWLEVSRGNVAMSRRIEASVERDSCHHEGGIVPSRANADEIVVREVSRQKSNYRRSLFGGRASADGGLSYNDRRRPVELLAVRTDSHNKVASENASPGISGSTRHSWKSLVGRPLKRKRKSPRRKQARGTPTPKPIHWPSGNDYARYAGFATSSQWVIRPVHNMMKKHTNAI